MSVVQSTALAAFQLKGSMLPLTVLQLLRNDEAAFSQQLQQLVQSTPNFFRNAPVVIDLEKLSDGNHIIDFARLKAELIAQGFVPVGVRHATETQAIAAMAAGFGILAAQKKVETPKPSHTNVSAQASKIVTQPVRSGQQMHAPKGDLIVLASVSTGAELMAEGNIHVYGTLRGRALAGIGGNIEARIFCHKLEAELIAIAGVYRLRDDIPQTQHSECGVQIYLEGEKLKIASI